MTPYQKFLETKRLVDLPTGFTPHGNLNASLFGFQHDITRWALKRGRAAIFADCGLGKTPMQLVWAQKVSAYTKRPVLIFAPLAVTAQTQREGEKFGIEVNVCRKQADATSGINITNYEMLQHFDPAVFGGVVLDESGILKSYDGKFRTPVIESFRSTPFRLACTATPAPNDHMELGNHAEFLGTMTRQEMLAMFFVHDGGATQKWRLKGHAKREFWRWVSTWACMLRKPSDLGYPDEGFDLPPLNVIEHEVEPDQAPEGQLFAMEARTLGEQLKARKSTIEVRAQKCADIIRRKGGRWVVWCALNDESARLTELIEGAVEVKGADKLEDKERNLAAFTAGDIAVLVSKASIAGHGLNWQHCHQMAFVGLGHSYEQYYQATRRCWRFGQERPVDVHVITATNEASVVRNIERKGKDHEEMSRGMSENMSEFTRAEIKGTSKNDAAYECDAAQGKDWTLHLGDCVDVVGGMGDDSIHFSIFSPPFASLYTYSNSIRDMGNCRDAQEFLTQFRFLISEIYRVVMPGRLVAVHCMNLPTSKVRDGVIGMRDFRGDIIQSFADAGWIYHSEVCIWKDPVTAMQRTKALGLLYKQLRKDSAMSRQGIPDYVCVFRKPGTNSEPVTKTKETFGLPVWQRYASPIWTDIDQSNTLQRKSAREDADERHIAPLQLEVIERCIRLWTNPGDLVMSPFAGIGSEGYEAVRLDRKFVGAELKRSYWEQACRNLHHAETSAKAQLSLLG